MRISDWSSDVCSSDLAGEAGGVAVGAEALREAGTAPQAAERAEHLDLRSHGAAQVAPAARLPARQPGRSEEHTSELQSLMRISYAVFCLKKKNSNRY